MRWNPVLSAGALAIASVAVAGIGSHPRAWAARRCSLMPTVGIPSATSPHFLGRATPDSALAGPGATTPGSGGGHFGPAGVRPILGQVVEVERVGTSAAVLGLASGSRVVVVPWDYDSACQPVPWAGPAAWLRPGLVRFFHARLRAREHWAGGAPTFDAFAPQFDAYPGDHADPVFGRARAAVPAESVFTFFEAMPTVEGYPPPVSGEMLARVRAWADSHPELAAEWPVNATLAEYRYGADRTRADALRPSIIGTWRLTVALPQGETRIAWLRTANRPDGVHVITRRESADLDELDPGYRFDPFQSNVAGVEIWCHVATAAEDLPTGFDIDRRCTWPLHLAWPDSIRPDGFWPGGLEDWEFRDLWGREDSLMARLYEAHEAWFSAAWDAGSLSVWSGGFHTRAEPMRFTQVIQAGSLGVIRVEGVRVSGQTAGRPGD